MGGTGGVHGLYMSTGLGEQLSAGLHGRNIIEIQVASFIKELLSVLSWQELDVIIQLNGK